MCIAFSFKCEFSVSFNYLSTFNQTQFSYLNTMKKENGVKFGISFMSVTVIHLK